MDDFSAIIIELEKVKENLVTSDYTHSKSLDVDRIDLVINWLKEKQNDES